MITSIDTSYKLTYWDYEALITSDNINIPRYEALVKHKSNVFSIKRCYQNVFSPPYTTPAPTPTHMTQVPIHIYDVSMSVKYLHQMAYWV